MLFIVFVVMALLCLPSPGAARTNDKAFVVLCSLGSPVVVEAAIKGGADVNARVPKRGGFTPLHAVAGANSEYRVIETLLKGGADVNARAENGVTPLHIVAIENTNAEVKRILLGAGRM